MALPSTNLGLDAILLMHNSNAVTPYQILTLYGSTAFTLAGGSNVPASGMIDMATFRGGVRAGTLVPSMAVTFGNASLPTLDDGGTNAVSTLGTPTMSNNATRGYVVYLNGTASLGVANYTLSTSYTKMAWVLRTNSTEPANIISSQLKTGQCHFFFINGGQLSLGHDNAGAITFVSESTTTFPTNAWVHACATYDDTTKTVKLYRNGTQTYTGTYNRSGWAGGGLIRIGAFGTDSWITGLMDDVKLFNRVLSASEIATAM